jgi:hypothetical protein
MTIDVTFFTNWEELKEAMPPVPATKFWPEWFKKQSGAKNMELGSEKNGMAPDGSHQDGYQTVKSCPAVLDVLNMGYVIPLWSDYKVKRVEKNEHCPQGIVWRMPAGPQSNMFGAATHPHEQMDAYPFPPDTFEGTFKLINPWSVKTPPGYSCYVCAPHYNKHGNLEVLNGVIDTDIYHELHVNTWFTAPIDEEVLLPISMPIVQIIPFKREDFQMDIKVGDHRSMHNKVTQFIHNAMFKAQHYRAKLSPKRYK